MTPIAEIFVPGVRETKTVEFTGDIRFNTGEDESDLREVTFQQSQAAQLVVTAMRELLSTHDATEASIKATIDRRFPGKVMVNGQNVPGSGFQSDPISVDKIKG